MCWRHTYIYQGTAVRGNSKCSASNDWTRHEHEQANPFIHGLIHNWVEGHCELPIRNKQSSCVNTFLKMASKLGNGSLQMVEKFGRKR